MVSPKDGKLRPFVTIGSGAIQQDVGGKAPFRLEVAVDDNDPAWHGKQAAFLACWYFQDRKRVPENIMIRFWKSAPSVPGGEPYRQYHARVLHQHKTTIPELQSLIRIDGDS